MGFGIRILSPFHLATLILQMRIPKNAKNACADALHTALKGWGEGGVRFFFDFGKTNKAISFLWLNRVLSNFVPIKFQHFAPFLAKNFVQQMSNPFGAAGGANGRKWPLLAKYGPFLAKNAEILWVQGWTILCLTKETMALLGFPKSNKILTPPLPPPL